MIDRIREAEPYPERALYDRLYAKWLQGGTGERMLDLADPSGKRLLDLCGGGGRISIGALERGAKEVLWLDRSEAMGRGLKERAGALADRLQMRAGSIDQSLASLEPSAWDAAICQQAVNYWLDEATAKSLAEALAPGGVFVFNTFWREPSREIAEKRYAIGEDRFVERYRLGEDGWVEHEQILEGVGSHATRFRWIPPEEFGRLLGKWLECEETRSGASALWVCRKRGAAKI